MKDEELLYGIELIKQTFLHYVCILLISSFMGGIKGIVTMILFTILFTILREQTGGFHADSKWKCLIISLLITIIVLFFMKIKINTPLLLTWICSVFVYRQSPEENLNNPLLYEKEVYQKRVLLILIVYNFAGLIIKCMDVQWITSVISLSILTDYVLLNIKIQ